MSSKSNTEKIVKLAEQKSQQARQQVKQALQMLKQRGEVINFASVCREAKVSKTFLYDPKHADLAEEIRRSRVQPVLISPLLPTTVIQEAAYGKTQTAKDIQITRLKEHLRLVEQQVERLKQENELLYGKLADWQAGTVSRSKTIG